MSGRSKKGRGGCSGDSSSARSSTHYSTPSASTSHASASVNITPLPSQYNFTPHTSIPEMAPPLPPSAIPPSVPPSQQQQVHLPMSLADLLSNPNRETYLPVLSLNPEEGIWFDRGDKEKITRRISKNLKAKFHGPYYRWSKVPNHIKDDFFITFAQQYH